MIVLDFRSAISSYYSGRTTRNSNKSRESSLHVIDEEEANKKNSDTPRHALTSLDPLEGSRKHLNKLPYQRESRQVEIVVNGNANSHHSFSTTESLNGWNDTLSSNNRNSASSNDEGQQISRSMNALVDIYGDTTLSVSGSRPQSEVMSDKPRTLTRSGRANSEKYNRHDNLGYSDEKF